MQGSLASTASDGVRLGTNRISSPGPPAGKPLDQAPKEVHTDQTHIQLDWTTGIPSVILCGILGLSRLFDADGRPPVPERRDVVNRFPDLDEPEQVDKQI